MHHRCRLLLTNRRYVCGIDDMRALKKEACKNAMQYANTLYLECRRFERFCSFKIMKKIQWHIHYRAIYHYFISWHIRNYARNNCETNYEIWIALYLAYFSTLLKVMERYISDGSRVRDKWYIWFYVIHMFWISIIFPHIFGRPRIFGIWYFPTIFRCNEYIYRATFIYSGLWFLDFFAFLSNRALLPTERVVCFSN